MSFRLVMVLFSAILSFAIVVCSSRDTGPRHADQRMTAKNPEYDEKLAGRLIAELHLWYGSAALKTVNQMHNALAKEAF